jgi:hypothetical protein
MNRAVAVAVAVGVVGLAAALAVYLQVRPATQSPSPAERPPARTHADAAPSRTEQPAPTPPATTPVPEAEVPGEDGIRGAFVEAYCAQAKGDAKRLSDIYKAHGFDDPKAWTEAVTREAQDKTWLARALAEAEKRCP